MIEVARTFRKEPTGSEAILWNALRGKQLGGRKFRRQQPIGSFVVDFFCSEERLIVEVDGAIHANQIEADRARQELIESLGLRFVRVSAALVEQDLPRALEAIRAAFDFRALAPPPPTPPPPGGRGDMTPPPTPPPPGGRGDMTPPSPLVGEGGRGGGGQAPPLTLTARAAAWAAHVATIEAHLAAHQREIDELAFQLYGIDGEDRWAIEAGTETPPSPLVGEEGQGGWSNMTPPSPLVGEEGQGGWSNMTPPSPLVGEGGRGGGGDEDDDTNEEPLVTDHSSLVTALISYLVGCAFGRFDIRYATGERPTPVLPDPFAPLPACSPGMLTGTDGLPLRTAPEGYPLHIDANGILVDDPDHADDIVRRVRAALDVIFGERAEAIEREACQILGVNELRDYVRRPGKGGFWDDHIKRYAKSRRKAPIYWLLQAPRRSYALWIYLHRLDDDTLSKALVSYVEPKLRREEERLASLREAKSRTIGYDLRQAERAIERQEGVIADIRELRDRLDRAVKSYLKPDLNDGVVLTIAPLHELVPWKEAKHYWNELLAGKYAWSSIGQQLRAKGLVR
ncbi:DUF559 domain-containing protein [Candidatus Chloroploca sp. M-50]|uniref:DUF559 domain-containing protein n=1 Tax=Candidatus Chloroploca mongolica TaxID=2528176 RepID=A0ABS4DE38_9CHLR|nr:DUF559 domain-containing protein [Candidatus Chloroploca mongolica]MBP1467702.1 DUF559 domain-containing protein [Candidatus Chloroploca mongolica]